MFPRWRACTQAALCGPSYMRLTKKELRYIVIHRSAATSSVAVSDKPAPVAIVMLNMGGPSSLDGPVDGVEPFLRRLFLDGEIIKLGPLQSVLGPYIARKRAPRIKKQYDEIGGRSPIGQWTDLQGREMTRKLETIAPSLGPFKHYVAFRYAPPLTHDVLQQLRADGVTRAIAFSQYPQFSCTTTGSSLNHLWRESIRLGLQTDIKWSVVDRWHSHPTFLAAVARRVALGLARFPVDERDKVVIVFSAHSVPMLVVNRGDTYVNEIAATVNGVMQLIRRGVDIGDGQTDGSIVAGGHGTKSGGSPTPTVIAAARNPHVFAWQSKVGFLPWMGPPTSEVLKGLGRQGHTHVLVVPIAFTSDHVETLYEIDLEYSVEAKAAGISRFERAPSLNDEPLLSTAMAEIIAAHLTEGTAVASPQYQLNCAGCTNPACRTIMNPAAPYTKMRDVNTGCKVQCWPTGADVASLHGKSEPCA